MSNIRELLEKANENKKECEKKTPVHINLIFNKLYFALIEDAHLETSGGKERIAVKYRIFNIPQGTVMTEYYYTYGYGMIRYNELCETIGTDGDIVDLISKLVTIHLVQKDNFVNIEVLSEAAEEEVELEMNSILSEMKSRERKTTKEKKEEIEKQLENVLLDDEDF